MLATVNGNEILSIEVIGLQPKSLLYKIIKNYRSSFVNVSVEGQGYTSANSPELEFILFPST